MITQEKCWWSINCFALIGLIAWVLFSMGYFLQQPKQHVTDQTKSQRIQLIQSYQLPKPPVTLGINQAQDLRDVQASENAIPNQAIEQNMTRRNDGDADIQLSIDLPDDPYARQQIGKFLYQCVGIGFGVITKLDGEFSINMIHAPKKAPSKLLRKVHHSLFKNERLWQRTNSTAKDFVRIYPLWFDNILMSQVDRNIAGETLSSLHGTLHLRDKQLALKNIEVNNYRIKGDWPLVNGQLRGC